MSDSLIRPEVQALITRGSVEVDEVETLSPPCNPAEAKALIPAWTNSSFARQLDRTLVNLHFDSPPPSPWWTLYFVLQQVEKSINRPIGQPYAAKLAQLLTDALAGISSIAYPITQPTGYLLRAFDLATEAQQRLANWKG